MSERLSWAQLIVLGAAMSVDYVPLRSQINLPHGVWRSLVIRGFLQRHPQGWGITEKGRRLNLKKVKVTGLRIRRQPTERMLTMDGKLPRYRVARTIGGWAVIDRSVTKIKMHNDVVERYNSRTPARIRCRELNLLEKQRRERETAA